MVLVHFGFEVDAAKLQAGNLDANLLVQFAPQGLFHRLPSVPAAAGEIPVALAIAVANQQDASCLIEDDSASPKM